MNQPVQPSLSIHKPSAIFNRKRSVDETLMQPVVKPICWENPSLTLMRNKKREVIERVVSNRIKSQMWHLSLEEELKNQGDGEILEKKYINVQKPRTGISTPFLESPRISNRESDQTSKMRVTSTFLHTKRKLSQSSLSQSQIQNLKAPQSQSQIPVCVHRQFKITKDHEDIDLVKQKLRKNLFFHKDFDPSLGSSQAQAFYSSLYSLPENRPQSKRRRGSQTANQELAYPNIYDYFSKNKAQITKNLKKARKISLVKAREVFQFKRESRQEAKDQTESEVKRKIDQKIVANPAKFFEVFEEQVDKHGEDFGCIHIDFKGMQLQEQIKRSEMIMKQKFEKKQKIDHLRSLEKLGIDLIIQNQDLFDNFKYTIGHSLNRLSQENIAKAALKLHQLQQTHEQERQYYLKRDDEDERKQQESEESIQFLKQLIAAEKLKIAQDLKKKQTQRYLESQLEQQKKNRSFDREMQAMEKRKKQLLQCQSSGVKSQLQSFSKSKGSSGKDGKNKSIIVGERVIGSGGITERGQLGSWIEKKAHDWSNASFRVKDSSQDESQKMEQDLTFLNSQQQRTRVNYISNKQRVQWDPKVENLLSECRKYNKMNPKLSKSVREGIDSNNKDSEELRQAVFDFQELRFFGLDWIDFDYILEENKQIEKNNLENYLNQKILSQLKEKSKQTTLFIQNMGRKKLWKPDKFIMSRKVKVATNYNDLLHE